MNYNYPSSLLGLILGFMCFVVLSGCSTLVNEEVVNEEVVNEEVANKEIVEQDSVELKAAQNTLESLGVPADTEFSVDIYDPWEKTNRKIYNFNAQLDDYLLIPIVDSYNAYVPRFLRQAINNVYSNFSSVHHTINSGLQLKWKNTINNGMRFLSNSTLGIAGIFDIATGMGFPEIREDFGQVLGHWGVSEGPYIVLPFFGPSNLRDSVGLVADSFIADTYLDGFNMNSGHNGTEWEMIYYGLMGVDIRSSMSFRYYDSLTPFEYEMIRLMNTAQRRVLIGE